MGSYGHSDVQSDRQLMASAGIKAVYACYDFMNGYTSLGLRAGLAKFGVRVWDKSRFKLTFTMVPIHIINAYQLLLSPTILLLHVYLTRQ